VFLAHVPVPFATAKEYTATSSTVAV